MNDNDRIAALLDLVDPEPKPAAGRSAELAVLGLAVKNAQGVFRPTTAGWNLLGDSGRSFRGATE